MEGAGFNREDESSECSHDLLVNVFAFYEHISLMLGSVLSTFSYFKQLKGGNIKGHFCGYE